MRIAALVALLLFSSNYLSGGEVDCDAFPFNVVIHRNRIAPSPHQTPELLLESEDIAIPRGGKARFYVSLVSQLEDDGGLSPGIQGFQLALNVLGNVSIDSATTDGTASALFPEGLHRSGLFCYFEIGTLVGLNGETTGPGIVFVHAFVGRQAAWMLPTGTATVLAVDLAAPVNEDPAGEILFRDGGIPFVIEPLDNHVVVRAESGYFGPPEDRLACARGARIVAAAGRTFVRGDADGNGRLEITDGIHIHRHLFLGDPDELACEDAADVNDTGHLDITDGVVVFNFLFIGGRQPAPPFPGCGLDPGAEDRLTCGDFAPCRS